MFDPSKFTVAAPKSVPVLFLLDVSGSMNEDCEKNLTIDYDDEENDELDDEDSFTKIDALNNALNASLDGFCKAQTLETFIKLGIISFGAELRVEQSLVPVNEISKSFDLKADGSTPLGAALKMAKAMIEDKEIFLGSDYRPAIVLLSDGMPNDDWEGPLEDFINTGRSAKCDRFAIAFGEDADKDMLRRFIAGCDNDLFEANDAENLYKVFKKITMSVSQRVSSQNKNASIKISLEDDPTSF